MKRRQAFKFELRPAGQQQRAMQRLVGNSVQNQPSQAKFKCTECGYQENADLNVARNILAVEHVILALYLDY